MPNDPVPERERLVEHQPAQETVTAYDFLKLQENVAQAIIRLQDQINAIEARVGALE